MYKLTLKFYIYMYFFLQKSFQKFFSPGIRIVPDIKIPWMEGWGMRGR